MQGTIVNTLAIVVGALIGIALGRFVTSTLQKTITNTLGLATLVIGMQMALRADDLLPIVGALLLGTITGEVLKIEEGISALGERLKNLAYSRSSTFVVGFVSASFLYLLGAMSIIGAIEDGLGKPPTVLYLKSLLDFSASIALASAFGIGVAFAAISVFLFQGAISLAAAHLEFLSTAQVTSAISTMGGILIVAVGINLLEIAKIRLGSLLPGIVYIVLWALYQGS